MYIHTVRKIHISETHHLLETSDYTLIAVSENMETVVQGKCVREEYLVMPWKTSTQSFQTYASSQIVRAGLFLSLESICCLAPVRFRTVNLCSSPPIVPMMCLVSG